jgi:hypothetical protein
MNALAARDAIFSELHSTVLKPLGFRKKGHWSILNDAPLFRSVYLRASRWSSAKEATFWIDVQVFHSDWFSLLWGPKTFPGPAESTPSLVSEELNKMLSPQMYSLKIEAATDIDGLTTALSARIKHHALPLLQQCASLEGVLSYYQSRSVNDDALSAAAVCILLGREEEARQFMKTAKETASHENYLRWLEIREKAMWANAAIRQATA